MDEFNDELYSDRKAFWMARFGDLKVQALDESPEDRDAIENAFWDTFFPE